MTTIRNESLDNWGQFIKKDRVERDGNGFPIYTEKATYRLVQITRTYPNKKEGEFPKVEVMYDNP